MLIKTIQNDSYNVLSPLTLIMIEAPKTRFKQRSSCNSQQPLHHAFHRKLSLILIVIHMFHHIKRSFESNFLWNLMTVRECFEILKSKRINWHILTSQVLHGDYNLITNSVSEKLSLNFNVKYSHVLWVALFTWSSYEQQHNLVKDHVFSMKLTS